MQYGEFYFTLFRKARIFIVDKLNEASRGRDEYEAGNKPTNQEIKPFEYVHIFTGYA